MIEDQKRKLIRAIREKRSFCVVGHPQPDGDSLGTQLGLYHVLRALGKDVVALVQVGDIPPQYAFLPGLAALTEVAAEPRPVECFIGVDVPNLDRLGDARRWFDAAGLRVNVDHHLDNAAYADVNVVDIRCSSTAELVFWALEEGGIDMPFEAALCLYVGIVTDTGRFQYSNTTASTFEAARRLVERGVRPNEVFTAVYENLSFEALRLLGKVLERAGFRDGFVWSVLDEDDMRATGARMSETETFIDLLRAVGSARAAAIFKQVNAAGRREWRVSLRAKPGYDVQSVAAKYGGGGHTQAAGFRTERDVADVIDDVIAELNRQEALKD